MNDASSLRGKIAYSLLFMVLLPALLYWWAVRLDGLIVLPVWQSTPGGAVLLALGGALMAAGMYALWRYGHGLPMNAYPPLHFVTQGVYRWLPHPIYTGFGLICFGVSWLSGSPAGWWVVSPAAVLGCVALVLGYEQPDLQRRFGGARQPFRVGLPPAADMPAVWYQRLCAYILVLGPWFFLNAAALYLYAGKEFQWTAFVSQQPQLPLSFSGVTVWLALFGIVVAPLVARTQHQLRDFMLGGLAGGGLLAYLAFVAPAFGLAHRWNSAAGPEWQQALLSFSWFWIWLAADIYRKAYPGWRVVIPLLAGIATIGVIFGGADPALNIAAGFGAVGMAFYYPAVWEYLREVAEHIANSWREWRFGPLRVINHGFYVGAAACGGALAGGWLAGAAYMAPIVVFGVIVTVCAGLWGQLVEGSDKLKRPFGFYGAMLGIILAGGVMYFMQVNVWVMLGVFSVFMPWVQGVGRLRCLVNGCCHGAPGNELVGIRYVHPRSRVCYLAHLKGKPLHPTPLYSLLWLALVGGLQIQLWRQGAPLSMLFGSYLMLNGMGRFVEEAYRGEPQTPVYGGLRLYQWAALVSVLAGIAVSTIPTTPAPLPAGDLDGSGLLWAVGMGVFVQFLMGIDFPDSQLRFSRLT